MQRSPTMRIPQEIHDLKGTIGIFLVEVEDHHSGSYRVVKMTTYEKEISKYHGSSADSKVDGSMGDEASTPPVDDIRMGDFSKRLGGGDLSSSAPNKKMKGIMKEEQ